MIHHPLDFDDMVLLVSISKTKSLTKTSQELDIAIGNIRKRIAKMEDYFGQPIYTRKSTGIALTRLGEELSAFYEEFLGKFSFLKNNIDTLDEQTTQQKFTIAATQGLANDFVIPILAEFMKEHPNVTVFLQTYVTERELLESYADIILWPKIDAARYRLDLKVEHFFTSEFGLYASKDYLEKHGNPELQKEGHVVAKFFDFNSSPFSEASNILYDKAPSFKTSQEIRVNNHSSMIHLVKESVAIGPVWNASPAIEAFELVRLFKDLTYKTDTYLIFHKNITQTHITKCFSNLLISSINAKRKTEEKV